VEEGQVSAHA